MIYQIRSVIGGVITLLGLIHVGFAFPVGMVDTEKLWFMGAGMAIVLSGLLNIIAVINCMQRWLAYITLAANTAMLALFLFGRQALQEPQIYVGIYLYLAAALLLIFPLLKKSKKFEEYKHYPRAENTDAEEILKATRVVPLLRIFDQKKSREFYVDWLGFSIDWEHRFEENFPLYMQLSKAGIVLHLTEHHGDCAPGAKVYIECDGLREYHSQLLNKNYSFNRPGLEMASWGSLAMTVVDPFGNRLLFTASH